MKVFKDANELVKYLKNNNEKDKSYILDEREESKSTKLQKEVKQNGTTKNRPR